MGNTEDFYQVLNIPRESSPEQIRRAYKILVKKWHPDKHPPSSKPEAEARFKAISQAYELALNESEGRAACGFSGGSGGGAPNLRRSKPPPPAPGFRTEETAAAQRKSVSNPKDVRYTTSQSGSAWPKPSPVEKQLDCTLEELFNGCRKEIRFHRDVVINGVVVRQEEMQKVKVKPGWKKGTKITFEGMGDERPGCLPTDIVFVIAEKEHPLFKRVGDDLVLKIEVALVNALAGWTFSVPLIGGEKMTLSFQDEIIYPGYEKVVKGYGMPLANEKGARGDLRIRFQVKFPTKLNNEQRTKILDALSC